VSAEEIIDAIGLDSAAKLSRELGGKCVYVPQTPSPDNPIAGALGIEALAKLTAAIGSGVLYIPTGIYRRERDARISILLAKGCTAKRLARALRISPRTVRHISRFDRMKHQIERQAANGS